MSQTVRDALVAAAKELGASGADTPWLDAWVLLSNVLRMDRERLFAAYTDTLGDDEARRFRRAVAQRKQGHPVSYIVGRKEFYGLVFTVNERVLVPRPDTEAMVDAAIAVVDAEGWICRVHDCCTGSGCVAVVLAHERPYLDVSASDISAGALEVAAQNSERLLGRRLELFESDLLSSVPGTFDVITANAPYIRSAEYAEMRKSGWPEPAVALEAGDDGLDAYRRLIPQSVDSLCKGGYLFVEAADNQSEDVCRLLRDHGYEAVGTAEDLGGRRRVCFGRLAGGKRDNGKDN